MRKECQLVPEHGNATEAPSKQKCPGLQDTHAVVPSASWKVPAAHFVHSPFSGWSLNVPALQLVAAPLPTGQNVPSPHLGDEVR